MIILKRIFEKHGVKWIYQAQDVVTSCCENGNEPLVSIKESLSRTFLHIVSERIQMTCVSVQLIEQNADSGAGVINPKTICDEDLCSQSRELFTLRISQDRAVMHISHYADYRHILHNRSFLSHQMFVIPLTVNSRNIA